MDIMTYTPFINLKGAPYVLSHVAVRICNHIRYFEHKLASQLNQGIFFIGSINQEFRSSCSEIQEKSDLGTFYLRLVFFLRGPIYCRDRKALFFHLQLMFAVVSLFVAFYQNDLWINISRPF